MNAFVQRTYPNSQIRELSTPQTMGFTPDAGAKRVSLFFLPKIRNNERGFCDDQGESGFGAAAKASQ